MWNYWNFDKVSIPCSSVTGGGGQLWKKERKKEGTSKKKGKKEKRGKNTENSTQKTPLKYKKVL